MKKKIMAVLLAAGVVVSPMGMDAVWAEETDSDWVHAGYKWTYIGNDTEVRLPEGMDGFGYINGNTIYDNIFGIEKVKKIIIPSSLDGWMYGLPFAGAKSLEEIVVETGNKSYASDNGVLFNKEKTTLYIYPQAKKGGYTISNGVTDLRDGAFLNCKSLTSISIPSSVTSIGSSAFSRCTSLTSISIPSGVTEIDQWTFFECENLTSISIPSSVTSIRSVAFSGCTSLASISIPSSVTSIYSDAFHNCSSLTDVYYGGSQEQWEKIARYSGSEEKITKESIGLEESVVIHYNSTGPENPSQSQETPENSQKPTQKITTPKNITKTYGAKAFSLNAKVNTGAKRTYSVSDKKVATVDKKGKVTIKGCGITDITITAAATGDYKKTTKTIKLTVKPKKATLSSVKSTKKKTAAVKWKRNKEATGYIIQCAIDSKFKKNKVQTTIGKNKTISATVKKLKAGKKYYVRVCAYKKSGKTKVQGDWSKVKTVKVKK